jgi:predicted CXXCH cytochrome family protein
MWSAPFSHRVHLARNMQCVSCHTKALASQKATDNLLPERQVCLGCHKEGEFTIKQPAKLTVSKFNHQLHGKFGNIAPMLAAAVKGGTYLSKPPPSHLDTKLACASCHHGIEQSEAVSHAVFPQMADCLVCHNKIDPPFSCEQCHDNVKQLKPANHVSGFMDTHNRKDAGLDKTTCAVCHGQKFTCLGCH